MEAKLVFPPLQQLKLAIKQPCFFPVLPPLSFHTLAVYLYLCLYLHSTFSPFSICVSIWSVEQISFNCEITLSPTAQDQFLFQGTIKAYLILLSKPMPVPALPHARPNTSLYQHIFTVFFFSSNFSFSSYDCSYLCCHCRRLQTLQETPMLRL